jgi:hypothetical protein
MDGAMLRDEEVPLPSSIRSILERRIEEVGIHARGVKRALFVLKVAFTLVGAGMVTLVGFKLGLTTGEGIAAACGIGFFVLLFWVWPQEKFSGEERPEDESARLRTRLKRGTILMRCLTVTDEQAWIEHEHGVTLYVPADERRTLYVDISSVTVGDPRWSLFDDGTIFRREWTWYQFTDEERQLHEFSAAGEAFEPVKLGHNDDAALELFEEFGSPGDGEVLDRPWSDVHSTIRAKFGRKS